MKTIWLTGFGSFPGVEDNPTEHIARALHAQQLGGLQVDASVLPVTFADACERVTAGYARVRPALAIHLGVAGRRRLLCLERGARNVLHPERLDAAGSLPPAPRIDMAIAATATRTTTLALPAVLTALETAGYGARISADAGDYLCNLTYWHSLLAAESNGEAALFIHVPPIGAVDPRSGLPWDLERLTAAVRQSVVALCAPFSGQEPHDRPTQLRESPQPGEHERPVGYPARASRPDLL